MAATAYKTTVPAAGWYTCATCRERLAPGSRAFRNGSTWTHIEACSAPVVEAAPAPVAQAPAAPAPRRNRFPGTCECGRRVSAGAGYLEEGQVFCGHCGLSSCHG